MNNYELIAAVDLGSNSFRLQVGRIVGNQVYPLDFLRESVRLGAGLMPNRMLDGPSQLRALEALSRFGERLRGFDPGAVRAVGTNTWRVAKNIAQFLPQAEAALGFPIEIIAGREEARLIYLGVAHSSSHSTDAQQLVVDIGGGSTEFIIGQRLQPQQLESLYIGCLSYSLQFFPEGQVNRKRMKEAELAARNELQTIATAYLATGWQEVIGTSGTVKAIAEILEQNGLSDGGITRSGLEALRSALVQAEDTARLSLVGLHADRIPVLPGGVAILSAIFRELNLERMVYSEGALRLGVLYDLLGRTHHDDLRVATVAQFMQRYGVDHRQADRVTRTTLALLHQMAPELSPTEANHLEWAARLHEIGISVAHAGYHKHSAYILANADMPGFSRRDQLKMSSIVLAHRGRLTRVQSALRDPADCLPIFAIRIAVLLHRARDDAPPPPVTASVLTKGFQLVVESDWLTSMPLTAAALEGEARQWADVGMTLRILRKKS
ncbi:MAG: exopolyphosphatase [Rhodocyclaceae bacterium]|nr:exopolyphosphatase [Rhodocyclaceae bacterium]